MTASIFFMKIPFLTNPLKVEKKNEVSPRDLRSSKLHNRINLRDEDQKFWKPYQSCQAKGFVTSFFRHIRHIRSNSLNHSLTLATFWHLYNVICYRITFACHNGTGKFFQF